MCFPSYINTYINLFGLPILKGKLHFKSMPWKKGLYVIAGFDHDLSPKVKFDLSYKLPICDFCEMHYTEVELCSKYDGYYHLQFRFMQYKMR